jgi:hypothetical protein
MKRKFLAVVVAVFSVVMLFGSGSASAARASHDFIPVPDHPGGYWRCTNGYFCAFQHYGGNGWYIEGSRGFVNLAQFGMNDQISSITNRSVGPNPFVANLYDWYPPGQCWILLHSSGPGNWGDIAGVDNRADGIGVNGALDGNRC